MVGALGWSTGLRLPHRHRMLKARAERKPLQDAILGLRARLLDVGVDLHGLTIPATGRTGGDDHLFHQVSIGQQLLHEGFLLFPLLGELGQTMRRGLGQNDAFHQLRVQFVTCQKPFQQLSTALAGACAAASA